MPSWMGKAFSGRQDEHQYRPHHRAICSHDAKLAGAKRCATARANIDLALACALAFLEAGDIAAFLMSLEP